MPRYCARLSVTQPSSVRPIAATGTISAGGCRQVTIAGARSLETAAACWMPPMNARMTHAYDSRHVSSRAVSGALKGKLLSAATATGNTVVPRWSSMHATS